MSSHMFDTSQAQAQVSKEEWKLIHKQLLVKNCLAGIVMRATGAAGSDPTQKQGITSHVTFYYFGLQGRGDPLRQMFEYHGQPYDKVSLEQDDWAA